MSESEDDDGTKDLVIDDDLEVVDDGDKVKVQPKEQGCFIATAAYGTPTATEIDRFRKFRDDYLVGNRSGRAFLLLYYGRDGTRAASSGQFISNHPWMAKIVRNGVLKPMLGALRRVQGRFVPGEYEESDGWLRFRDEHLDTSGWVEANEKLERE